MACLERIMECHKKNIVRPKVSVIIPVYKAETYIYRCLDSIKAQTLQDWELILVDDGSPDNSGVICDEYAREDKRIKVFHKKNGGVASARELAMRRATGEYSIHVDPDDWTESDFLELLYKIAKQEDADIVICDFMFDYSPTFQVKSVQRVDSKDIMLQKLLSQELHGSLCNKLIRTDLFARYDLHFPTEMICWEDLYICCNLAFHRLKIEYLPRTLYHYDLYSNSGSMTRKATKRTLDGMKSFCAYFDSILRDEQRIWLYETKGLVLLTAYRSGLMDEIELRHLYPEINDWYVKKYGGDYEKVYYCALAKILSGKSMKFARRFQVINSFKQRIKNQIVSLLK